MVSKAEINEGSFRPKKCAQCGRTFCPRFPNQHVHVKCRALWKRIYQRKYQKEVRRELARNDFEVDE